MVTRSFLGSLKEPLLLVFSRILLGVRSGYKGTASLFLGSYRLFLDSCLFAKKLLCGL